MKIGNVCKKILYSEQEIYDICKRLGERITNDYMNDDVIMIGLLNGCNPFFSDLVKHINLNISIDYIKASSYHGTVSTGEVKILKDSDLPVTGKRVIVVDDIIDTGSTVKRIIDILKYKGATDVEVCVLLQKSDTQIIDYLPKYIGAKIPNAFVIGYGLDYNEHYRNLPYIGIISDELIEEK